MEKNIKKECIYMHDWATLLYSRNWQNIVNQLHFTLFYFIFCFLGLQMWHMKVPLGAESEVLAYTTARTTWDRSCIWDLQHSNARSFAHWARQGIEPTSSWILAGFVTCWAVTRTPTTIFWFKKMKYHHQKRVDLINFIIINDVYLILQCVK